MPWLLLIAASLASAAPVRPPEFAPEGALRDVANADASLFQAIDRLLSTPFDPPRIPQLRSTADDILAGGQGVVSACATMDSLMEPALQSAEAHAFGPESAERRVDALSRDLQRLQQRLAADRGSYHQACANQEQRRSYCDRALDALRAAENADSEADGPYKDADSARPSVTDTARRLRDARAEFQSKRAAIERAQSSMPQAAVDFKSRVDAIAAPPEAENRTRAYGAQNDLLNPAREVHGGAQPAREKAARFDERYRGFVRAAAQFSDAATAARGKLDALESNLHALENILR
jgi:hypothetical protein